MFSQPDIDGGLVGGASLDAAGFTSILVEARSRAQRLSQLNI
jgi:triosephosphate isomerase